MPIFATKAELREDFLEWFALILQVYYENDGNQTHLVKAPDGTSVREFNHPEPARLQPHAAGALLAVTREDVPQELELL